MKRAGRQAVHSQSYGLAVILLTSILITGCSSMINPYLNVGPRPSTVIKDKDDIIKDSRDVSIDEAVAYANQVKDEYRDALGGEAKFSNLLGATLIGVATAVPIMAVADASNTAIGITAATGAGAYGLGMWLQSTPRQKAYIQGYNAINCAVEAISPLRSARNGDSYSTFKTAVNSVDSRIETVNEAIGAVVDRRSDKPKRADEAIAIARAAIKEAEEARAAAVELQLELDTSGDNLVNAVDRIVGEVDLMILQNQPDLAALSSIIGGLGGIYDQLSEIPPGLIGGGEIGAALVAEKGFTPESDNLEHRLAKLQSTVTKLATSTRQMGDFGSAVINRKPVEALKKCKVDPSVIASALTIKPPTTVFAGGVEETQVFVIQGGAHPYRVALLTGQGANMVVSQPDLFGPAFVVQVKADTPKATYSVYAADAAGRNTILNVMVGTPTPPGPGKQSGSDTPGGQLFSVQNEADRKKVQKALCVVQDGDWGKDTRAALTRHEGSDTMTQELLTKLRAMADEDIKKRCISPPASSLAQKLEGVAKFLKGNAVKVEKGGPDYGGAITQSRVASDAAGSRLLVKLNIPKNPNQAVDIKDWRTAVLEVAKTMPSFPSEVTVEIIEIENGEDLKTTGKLQP